MFFDNLRRFVVVMLARWIDKPTVLSFFLTRREFELIELPVIGTDYRMAGDDSCSLF